MFSTILVPVDGSKPSSNALHIGGDLAGQNGATLVIAHVLFRGASAIDLRNFAENEGFLNDVESDLASAAELPPPPMSGAGGNVEQVPDTLLRKIGSHLLERAKMAAAGRNVTKKLRRVCLTEK